MEKEEKICTVQSTLNDGDFDDVYQVFLSYERGRERKTALIVCGVLCLICIGMLIAFRNIAFLFYGIGCLVIGFAYIKVPANRKFLAANKLQFGEKRETVFYPHSVTTEELFDEAVSGNDGEDESNDAAEFSTTSLQAYETRRGFIFADGRLTNQFLYVPKRCLDEDTEPLVRSFAKDRCSGGYALVQTGSMLEDEGQPEQETEGLTNAVADRYYGRKQLHLYDEDGHRIDFDDEEDDDMELDESIGNLIPPELDVDAALKDILEDTDEPD